MKCAASKRAVLSASLVVAIGCGSTALSEKSSFIHVMSVSLPQKEEADRCKVDITRRHIGNSLKSWLEWEKHPEDTTSGKECVDSQSSCELHVTLFNEGVSFWLA